MGPEIKTSGPEFANTGSQSELPPPSSSESVPTLEAKVVTEGVRVISVRRPNVHKQKKALPEVSTGSVSEQSFGAVSPVGPDSASGVSDATVPADAIAPAPESPEAPQAPQASAAEPGPNAQMPAPPMPSAPENAP